MRVHILLGLLLLSVLTPLAKAQQPNNIVTEQEWPGEPVDNHVHMTWAALTLEVNGWADDFPEITLSRPDAAAITFAKLNMDIKSEDFVFQLRDNYSCLLYTSPSPRDAHESRMPSSA